MILTISKEKAFFQTGEQIAASSRVVFGYGQINGKIHVVLKEKVIERPLAEIYFNEEHLSYFARELDNKIALFYKANGWVKIGKRMLLKVGSVYLLIESFTDKEIPEDLDSKSIQAPYTKYSKYQQFPLITKYGALDSKMKHFWSSGDKKDTARLLISIFTRGCLPMR